MIQTYGCLSAEIYTLGTWAGNAAKGMKDLNVLSPKRHLCIIFNIRYAMKKPILFILFISIATISQGQEIDTVFKKILLSEVSLLDIRASKRTPMTALNL